MATNTKTITDNTPIYHPFDDSFINDPNSMKFRFTNLGDWQHNMSECACEVLESMNNNKHSKKKNRSKRIQYENMKNPVVERPIPRHKKKKYPTKPKNRSKINKMKESNNKFRI